MCLVHDCGEGGMSHVYILHLFAGVAPLVSTSKLCIKKVLFFLKSGVDLLISIFRIL